jgi:crossover junction endodeoxyribonuclease RusA
MPLKIVSEANCRDHWRVKAKRVKAHRTTTQTMLRSAYGAPSWAGPLVITLTRIGPRDLDTDNCIGGFKAMRDGIADWLGINDGDKAATWNYEQERGKPNQYAARVVIEWSKA